MKITWHIKCRTYSRNSEDLWLEEWRNPLTIDAPVQDPAAFLQKITAPIGQSDNDFYVDKLSTGFLVWAPSVKAYRPPPPKQPEWESVSQPALKAIQEVFSAEGYFSQVAQLFGQESNKEANRLTLRSENAIFIKSIGALSRYMYTCESVPNTYAQPRCIKLNFLERYSLQLIRLLRRMTGLSNEQRQKCWQVCFEVRSSIPRRATTSHVSTRGKAMATSAVTSGMEMVHGPL